MRSGNVHRGIMRTGSLGSGFGSTESQLDALKQSQPLNVSPTDVITQSRGNKLEDRQSSPCALIGHITMS
jgi:hypothetical protein